MTKSDHHHTTTSHPGASRPLPTTVWAPDSNNPSGIATPGEVLPGWALDKIRAEFTHRPGRPPARLIKIHIRDTEPGMDARARVTYLAPYEDGRSARTAPVLLAELHPDTLPAPDDEPVPSCDQMPGAMENGWSGFFHRAHRLLFRNGILLLATRQRRDAGRLTDPLGSLIASARTAGFRYLQHIVIVHGHLDGDRIVPTPPENAPPGLIHSDLLVLSAITSV
ncbi:hypothetical protein V2J94_03420 [Streptomyces sp. DSM 41524]|uniref:Uncharacterized protein n=1 Tax=Streptomyces asiaticus subsp. ignotus TaxID=3098222 RepID=A0ABU7PR51_9ACTN|nr:hypothetical protein [Streptomyces sp. DSM 41524]